MEKKTSKRIAAGAVVILSYSGEDKPCNKAMGILVNPIKISEGAAIDTMVLLHSIDLDTEEFLPSYKKEVSSTMSVAKGKEKAWYFKKLQQYLLEQFNKQEIK